VPTGLARPNDRTNSGSINAMLADIHRVAAHTQWRGARIGYTVGNLPVLPDQKLLVIPSELNPGIDDGREVLLNQF
jgi:hypothetical protein